MLRGLFPRFFSMFRESGIIRGRFTFTAAGTVWTAVTGYGEQFVGLSVVAGGTGLVTVTFPKCRHVSVVHAAVHSATVGTFGNLRTIELPKMTPTIAAAGTFGLSIYKDDGVSGIPGLLDPVDGAELELVLICDK